MSQADVKYCVYAIENLNTKKKYIGSTCEYEKRLDRHFNELRTNKHHSIYLQRSFNHHGEDSFIFYKIQDNLTKEEAHTLEEQLINNDYDNLYNVSKKASGGDLISYHPNLEEIRKKHSANAKARWDNPVEGGRWTEIKTGEKNGMYGKTHTPEVREFLSKINKGRKHTDETRKNMSNAQIERYKDPKERRKTAEANRRRYESPEERRKTGEATRKVWEREGYREKVKESMKKNAAKRYVKFMYKGKIYEKWENAVKEIGLSQPTIMKALLDPNIEDCYYISEYIPASEETRRKQSESKRGKTHSEKTKKLIKQENIKTKGVECTAIFPTGVVIQYDNKAEFKKHISLMYGLSSGMIEELLNSGEIYSPKRYYLQLLDGVQMIQVKGD